MVSRLSDFQLEECTTSVPPLAHLATSNRLAVTDKGEQLLLSLRCHLDTGVPALVAISALSAYALTYALYTKGIRSLNLIDVYFY